MKKAISILLILTMIMSLFCGISISGFAEETSGEDEEILEPEDSEDSENAINLTAGAVSDNNVDETGSEDDSGSDSNGTGEGDNSGNDNTATAEGDNN